MMRKTEIETYSKHFINNNHVLIRVAKSRVIKK